MKRQARILVVGIVVVLVAAYLLTIKFPNLFEPPTVYLFKDISELATSKEMLYIDYDESGPRGAVLCSPTVYSGDDKHIFVRNRKQVFSLGKWTKYLFIDHERETVFPLPNKRVTVYPLGIWDGNSLLYYQHVTWIMVQGVTRFFTPPSQVEHHDSINDPPEYIKLLLSSYFDSKSNKVYTINFDLVDLDGKGGILPGLVTEVDLTPLAGIDPNSIKWEVTSQQSDWQIGTEK